MRHRVSRPGGQRRRKSKSRRPGFRRLSSPGRRLAVESLEERWLLNGAPVAVDDAFSVGQYDVLVKSVPGVLANDTDPDGDPLQVTSADTSDTLGLVAWNKSGSFAYDPVGHFDDLEPGETVTDTFVYTVSDGRGGTDTAVVTITIFGTHNPVANDDSYSTDEDTILQVSAPGLLDNDTDADVDDVLTISSVDTSETLGTVTHDADGGFSYDPTGKFDHLQREETAQDSFQYTVSDSHGGSATAHVTITMTGENDEPVAADDSYETSKNLPIDIAADLGLLANDTDADENDVLIVHSLDTSDTLGDVTWNADGSFTYDPNEHFDSLEAGEDATDTFTYTTSDGNEGFSTASVAIVVSGVDEAPVAIDDAYETDDRATLNVSAETGLLANDTHPIADAELSVTSVDTSSMLGDVSWEADGSFEYNTFGWFADLPKGVSDTDVFTYTVSDESGRTDTAAARIKIHGVNDPPSADDDSYETDEETPLLIDNPGLLANDFDVDFGDTLSISEVNTEDTLGSVTWDPDGGFEYDPNAQFDDLGDGEFATDTFTYTVSDRHGATDTAKATITIHGLGPVVNDAPVATDDAYAVMEDAVLSIAVPGLLGNDSDADGDSLQVIDVDATSTLGGVTWRGDGRFTYDPLGQFSHLAEGATATDTFMYVVSDGRGGTDTATVTITIQGVNEAPSAAEDTYATPKDTVRSAVAPGLLSNDTDPNGDALEVTGIDTAGTQGLVTWSADGGFEYDPNGQFDALLAGETATDVFTYTVTDVHGDSDTATVTITVSGFDNPDNQSPVAVDDSYDGDTDTTLFIAAPGLLENDSDPDGDPLQVKAIDTGDTLGLVAFQSNGSFGYDPGGEFTDLEPGQTATDSFTYTISDGQGGTDTATVTITFSGGPADDNQAPVAEDDSYSTDEDSPLSVTAPGLLANDTDPDLGDVLEVTAVDTSGAIGSVVWNPDGSFEYDPAGHFDHLAAGATATDAFTYTVSDGRGGSDTASVTITITGINNAPIAVDDAQTTDKNVVLAVPAPGLLDNDTDVDTGDVLTITALDTTETVGVVAHLPNGSFGYDPLGRFDYLEVDETATDTFAYTVQDSHGATDTATVTITITNTEEGPPSLAINDASVVEGNEGTSELVFTVSLSDASAESVSVEYATADGTAEQGVDYQAASGGLTFPSGITTQTISVPVIGDSLDEFDETFFVILSEPRNAVIAHGQGEAAITDDDEPPSISISDVTVVEGDSGSTNAVLEVSLSAPSGKSVTVDYATVDDSATTPEDYQATSGTLTFAPGETSQQVSVLVRGDTIFEPDETFLVLLNSPTNAELIDNSATVTIIDDDDRPTISIANAEILEGDQGTSPLVFTVSLSHGSSETISVEHATADGTATQANQDYEPTAGTLVFQPGEALAQSITVNVRGDIVEELDETFFVDLTNAAGATLGSFQAVGTILDDDASNAQLSGFVYLDVNNDGVHGERECGVPGILIRLKGTEDRGTQVDVTTVTDENGYYVFENLRAGTYEVIQTPHAAFLDGRETSGTLGGTVDNDRIWGIPVEHNTVGTSYNFGERGLLPQYISVTLFFASTPPPKEYLPGLMAAIEGQTAATTAIAQQPTPTGTHDVTPRVNTSHVTELLGADSTPIADSNRMVDSAVAGEVGEGESVGRETNLTAPSHAPPAQVISDGSVLPLPVITRGESAAIDKSEPHDALFALEGLDDNNPTRVEHSLPWDEPFFLEELLDDEWVRELTSRNDGEISGDHHLVDLLFEQEELAADLW